MYEDAQTNRTFIHQRLVCAFSFIAAVGALRAPTNRTAVSVGLRAPVAPVRP
jgi:hypothetical protein